MKQLCKRSLAVLLLLVMLVGYFSGITVKVSAASYVYNWGTREDVADQTDFARSTAEEWYAAEGTSYEELCQYAGSSNNSSVPSSALYQKLRSLMRGAVTNTTGYDATKNMYQYTDCQNGGGSISSFYSGKSIGPAWGEGGSWNREHTWPNSKGDNNGSGENDIFMLRPTATSENSSRGNEAYGESSGYYNPNSESGGKYDLRGDVVRIMLFVYVRWQNISSGGGVLFGSSGVLENRAVMLKWLEEDPVDTWELGRNDSCQSITGTRNVFVDYPELGFLLFGADIPAGYTSPSGGASSAYTVTATSNNTSYGTVSVSGKTITASPKTGYYAAGYTVTSGSATVTQDGNKFTVSASSDCTIRINFAAKTQYTLTYMAAGSQYTSKTAYGGDVIALSSYTGTVPEGYTFKGWVKTTVSDTETKPANIYTAGSSYTVTANATFHALFSYSVGGTGAAEYVLTDLADIGPSDSTVITITTSSGTVYAMNNDNGTSKAPAGVTITVKDSDSGKVLASEPADNLKWNVGGSADAYIFYPEGDTSKWLYCTGTNNGVRVGTTAANTFKIDSSSGYLFHNGTSRYIGVYTTNPDWRCYTTNGGNIANQTIGFYVLREVGTTYYTTVIGEGCSHTVVIDEAVAATCTETGLTEGSHCSDCGEILIAQVEVAALGHTEAEKVIAPTCTEQGYTIYYCSVCGEVDEESDYVKATGHSYSAGVCTVCGEKEGKTVVSWNICLGDNIGVSFQLNVAQTDTVSFTVAGNTVTAVKNGNTYTIYLAAPQMTDEIVISVGGEPVEDTYSVRKYADLILAGEYTDEEKNLVKAMLCYGGAAQNCFAYHTGSLASAGVEMATAIPTGEKTISISDSLDGLDFCGASLVYRTKTAVRFYFSGSVDGLTFQIGSKEYTPVAKGDMYYVEVADINPQDIGETIEVVVSDGADTLTVGYSPLTYIVRMYEKEDSSEATKNLVFSLYNYYLAAVAYLAEASQAQ